jgi:dTDP-4-amino-4,6-dideoxygalactose transaminase
MGTIVALASSAQAFPAAAADKKLGTIANNGGFSFFLRLTNGKSLGKVGH